MNKNTLYLVAISCLLFAGQVWAQTPGFLKKHQKATTKTALRSSSPFGELPVFPLRSGTLLNSLTVNQVVRPTTVYRETPLGEKSKYECEYDTYGHITLLKYYEWDPSEENYLIQASVLNEYHQLPNGEFVKTKEEREDNRWSYYPRKERSTSAYDSNGMQLWHQYESFDHNTSTWTVNGRTEARIENGIRTAILNNGVVDDHYTFDSKGRIITYCSGNYVDGTHYETSYTWETDNDRLVQVVENGTEDEDDDGLPDSEYTWIYNNLQIVHNEKYFDPYSLNPFVFGMSDEAVFNVISWGNFSIDDYTLHRIYYNVDATSIEDGEEIQGQIRITVNPDGNQIIQTTTIGTEIVYEESTSLLDGYGSYRIREEGDEWGFEHSVTYNEYGELLRDYMLEGEYERDYTYNREYNEGKPVKTSFSFKYNSTVLTEWEETYTTWTTLGLPSGIRETSQSVVSVYPNPVAEAFIIDGIVAPTRVIITDLSGRTVWTQTVAGSESVTIGHLPQGVYLVRINEKTVKIVKR
jgi:hypothetical protein